MTLKDNTKTLQNILDKLTNGNNSSDGGNDNENMVLPETCFFNQYWRPQHANQVLVGHSTLEYEIIYVDKNFNLQTKIFTEKTTSELKVDVADKVEILKNSIVIIRSFDHLNQPIIKNGNYEIIDKYTWDEYDMFDGTVVFVQSDILCG